VKTEIGEVVERLLRRCGQVFFEGSAEEEEIMGERYIGSHIYERSS
jgi:hypothetical protein